MHTFALSLLAFAGLASGALAQVDPACNGPNARTVPPPGAIIVDITATHTNDSYLTIAEGMLVVPNTTEEHTIFLYPGVYQEQVTVPHLAGPLVLQGYTCDTTSYAANQVTITRTMAQKDLPAQYKNGRNELASTVRLKSGNSVKMYNLNVANPTGKIDYLGQAVALYVDAPIYDKFYPTSPNYGFYACNFTGYQDTVCAHKGRELFARSYISGATDFVFGQRAKAWFESCDLETIGKGYITANGNSNSSNLSEYVFNRARVFNANASMNGTTYLGRPWKPYARVVFQNSELGDVVNPEGWSRWDSATSVDNVYFKEFNNSGSGAAIDQRVSFSGQLEKPVTIEDLFGEGYKSEWWIDAKFLQASHTVEP